MEEASADLSLRHAVKDVAHEILWYVDLESKQRNAWLYCLTIHISNISFMISDSSADLQLVSSTFDPTGGH